MRNNNVWKIIGVAITVAFIAGGIIYGYATLESQVSVNAKMQPEVELNTEHRYRFEEKVDNIERDVALILKEVRK